MMERIYVATCRLDGDFIRLMFIVENQLEAARRALYRRLPEVEKSLNEGEEFISVEFHEMPIALAAALHLHPGQTQDWWLGEPLLRKDQSEIGHA